MRKMKEIIRLRASGLSQRQIARSLNISKGTVGNYLRRAHHTKVDWLCVQKMDGKELKSALATPVQGSNKKHTHPDCEWIYQELKIKGVTLKLLHEEYQRQFPDNHYLYTQFCHYYSGH